MTTSVDVHEHKLKRPVKKVRKTPKLEEKDREALRQSVKASILAMFTINGKKIELSFTYSRALSSQTQ